MAKKIEKFVVISLEDEKAKEIAEVIKNKTCKKILDYLGEKEATETEIAQALNLPLSTVHYNLQLLKKSGLIKSKDFYWSEKGKKVNIFEPARKLIVLAPKGAERYKSILSSILPLALVGLLIIASILVYINKDWLFPFGPTEVSLEKFGSCDALNNAFKEASEKSHGGFFDVMTKGFAVTVAEAVGGVEATAPEYSETNVQVEGVDEADIVKNDGTYVYTLSKGRLIIARAYPADSAEILSETDLENFEPTEIFIHNDRLLIFGSTYEEYPRPLAEEQEQAEGKVEQIYPYYPSIDLTTVLLYDISDRSNPNMIKKVDFEGSYLTSRKIGSWVYFVINSWPQYRILEETEENSSSQDILPLYRETTSEKENKTLVPACKCADVQYFEPIDAQSFITLAAMSMEDENAEINKKVIVGSGENVYASLQNLYVAEMNHPYWFYSTLKAGERIQESTIVHKFSLDKENVEYKGNAQVPGHILNQFSMDEYNSYFRIATTKGEVWQGSSTNNVYILNENLNMTGKLEELAPGESIYSIRFMGNRAYMVTFKRVDPLFVIDLSNPENPSLLGKLKIPGYSDYLHPYDENHIIGIGKEVDESIDADKVHDEGAVYYTAIQGVKISLFDVTDVSNPIEMYKEVIGDRGTESLATQDHKAFLFNKEKELLVVPMTVAELKPGQPKSMQGDYTFQGAYVYRLTLENGFELKGRVTHYDTNESFIKSGYYYYGNSNVQRSLYIDNILYTISPSKIMLNSLDDLSMLKELKINVTETEEPIYRVM